MSDEATPVAEEFETTVKLFVEESPSEWLSCAVVYLYDRDRLSRDDFLGMDITDSYGEARFRFTSESAVENPTQTPFFADAIWVDAWPLETDRPARNLFDGDKFSGGGISRFAIPRHAAPLSAATKKLQSKIAIARSDQCFLRR